MKKRFGRLSNAVARDRRLLPETLVIAAYRSMIVGQYRLRERLVCSKPNGRPSRRGICDGLSRDVFRRAMRNAQKVGLVEWRQPKRRAAGGQWQFGAATETWRLPSTSEGYRIVRGSWFGHTHYLHVKSVAALLFVRAGSGRGDGVYPREVAERFGWSALVTSGVLRKLAEQGLIARVDLRGLEGRFAGHYFMDAERRDRRAVSAQPATGTTGNGEGVALQRESPEIISDNTNIVASTAHRATTRRRHGQPVNEKIVPALREQPDLEWPQLAAEAYSQITLLGWIHAVELTPALPIAGDDQLDASYAAVGDEALRRQLHQATGGRCAPDLMSPAGLYALRVMALAFVAGEGSVEDKLQILLSVIDARIAQQPTVWLNSYALIGKRLAAVRFAAKTSGDRNGLPSAPSHVVDAIRTADRGGTVINPRLYQRTAPLRRLCDLYGEELVVTTIGSMVTRGLIDGTIVNAWHYFESAIAVAASLDPLANQG